MTTTTTTYRNYRIEQRGEWHLAKHIPTNQTLTTGNTVAQVQRAIDHFLDRNCSMHKGECSA